MSSRSSSSPPRRRRHGCYDDYRAEPSVTSLYLRPLKFPRTTSTPALLTATASASPIRPSSPPRPPYDSFDQSGHHPLHQPQHQGESRSGSQPQQQEKSGSEFELDSPPRITIIRTIIEEDPGSPSSPPYPSPTSPPYPPALSPAFEIDTDSDEHDFSDEEDAYFKSLVDNFIVAADNVCNPTLPKDNIDYKVIHQQRSELFAKSALMCYNNDEKNKVKYELISVITSCSIVAERGCCGHVNFIAKGDQQNSKEELFFAELRAEDDTYVPNCVVSLEEGKSVGGLHDTRYDIMYTERGMPIDAQHCYACSPIIKHPKDGSLYVGGHIACGDYYWG